MRFGLLLAAGALAVATSCASGSGGGEATSTPVTSAPATSEHTTAATSTTTATSTTSVPPTSSVPSTTSVPPTTTATSAPPTSTADCTASWTVREKVAQLLMPAVRGQDLVAVAQSLSEQAVGGIIVMTWPEGTSAADLAAAKFAGRLPLLVGVDEEGGEVQRLRVLGRLPAPATVAATMSASEAETMIAAHAAKVASLGFDVVFAPVVDVTPEGGGGPIGNRSFGSDAATVATYGAAYVRGWLSAGILPVLKHFPGHGRATADSHLGTATTPPLASLRTVDLIPYEELRGSGAGVMVGHLDVPGLTEPGVPASLSPSAVTGLLRGELGYTDALVFTDALGMGAITSRFSVPEAAVRAIVAGADVALITSLADVADVIDALAAAVATGRLSGGRLSDALSHVLAAKHVSSASPACTAS